MVIVGKPPKEINAGVEQEREFKKCTKHHTICSFDVGNDYHAMIGFANSISGLIVEYSKLRWEIRWK
jgi:hypothetical protein